MGGKCGCGGLTLIFLAQSCKKEIFVQGFCRELSQMCHAAKAGSASGSYGVTEAKFVVDFRDSVASFNAVY